MQGPVLATFQAFRLIAILDQQVTQFDSSFYHLLKIELPFGVGETFKIFF